MWKDSPSDISRNSETEDLQNSDFGEEFEDAEDVSFADDIDSSEISENFGEASDAHDSYLEEDTSTFADAQQIDSLDSDESDTYLDHDSYLEEDTSTFVDAQQIDSLDSDESDTYLEEDSLDSSDDSEDGPILRRDPDEFTDIISHTLSQRADVLRDDLRDKGWEDGPEMEQYISSQMKQWETEAAETYLGKITDSTSGPFLEEDASNALLDEETSDQAAELDLSSGESSGDVSFLEEDTQEGPTSDYPSGFDYSSVDWGKVYHDIEEEQSGDVLQEYIASLQPADTSLDEASNLIGLEEDDGTDDGSPDITPEGDDSVPSDSSEAIEDRELPPISQNKDVQSISDVSGWLGEINPNFDEFDPESPYCNNCGSCAYAVYQRLEGSTDSCASADNIGYNSEMNALTGMEQVSMSPQEIEQRLLNQGDGAHAIIGIDRAEGPGHWFNAACLNGRVVAIDGQTGEISDWPPDYGDVVNWEMSIKKGA